MRKTMTTMAAFAALCALVAAGCACSSPEVDGASAAPEQQIEQQDQEEPDGADQVTVTASSGVDAQTLEQIAYEIEARYGGGAYEVTADAEPGIWHARRTDGEELRLEVQRNDADGTWHVYETEETVKETDADIAAQDQVSSLTSRKATFDVKAAAPLSSRKAASALGEECRSAAAEKIPSFLASRGLPGVTEGDIVVETSAEASGDKLAFAALAATGNERVVLACTWDEKASALSVEAME